MAGVLTRPLPALVLLISLGLMTACPHRPSPAPGANPDDQDEPGAPPPRVDLGPTRAEAPPAEPAACAEGGTLWSGKPEGCSYEHNGCCYPSAEAACKAAGCPAGKCLILESYPAQIACDT